MPVTILNSFDMTRRWTLALLRQPWFVAITLVQPVIWLLLFGSLFKKVVDIPGFQVSSYQDYLTPGIIVMTAVFTAGWSGMGTINDLERGVMDRLLVTPVNRAPLIVGPLAQTCLSIVVQAVIIIGLSSLVGASFPGGVLGVLAMTAAAVLVGAAIAGFSHAVALTARQEETLIGLVQFIALPLTFLSAAFMQLSLAPQWIQDIARYNPVNWAVEAGREAVSSGADWGFVLVRLGLLAGVAALFIWLATRAFRSYQRTA